MQTENNLSIDTLPGRNNILVIIPHAHKEQTGEDVSPMATLGHSLASPALLHRHKRKIQTIYCRYGRYPGCT